MVIILAIMIATIIVIIIIYIYIYIHTHSNSHSNHIRIATLSSKEANSAANSTSRARQVAPQKTHEAVIDKSRWTSSATQSTSPSIWVRDLTLNDPYSYACSGLCSCSCSFSFSYSYCILLCSTFLYIHGEPLDFFTPSPNSQRFPDRQGCLDGQAGFSVGPRVSYPHN